MPHIVAIGIGEGEEGFGESRLKAAGYKKKPLGGAQVEAWAA